MKIGPINFQHTNQYFPGEKPNISLISCEKRLTPKIFTIAMLQKFIFCTLNFTQGFLNIKYNIIYAKE